MATAISAPGTYGAGDYYLSAGFSSAPGETGAAITFTGATTLDLNGKTIQGTGSGNVWDTGILANATATIYDSVGGGAIKGFRVGVKLNGSSSVIRGVDLSFNRYFGAWLAAQGCKVIGGTITNISGVSDEAYAMGVQVNGLGCEVIGVEFREMYRQAAAAPGAVGEGLPVNFAAGDAINCLMARCVAINDRVEDHSYGVFAGAGGGHRVIENLFWNFWRGVAVAQVGLPEVRKNFIYISSPLVGSQGIASPDLGVCAENTVIGYESPMAGRLDDGTNIVLNFPTAPVVVPPPVPTETGTVLSATHNGSFGNIETKSLRCVVPLSLMSYPSGTITKIRPWIKAHADEPISLPELYFGQPVGSGDPYDAVALTRATLNGSTAIYAAAGQEVALDWITVSIDKAKGLLWSMYHPAGSTNDKISAVTNATGATSYLADGNSASVANASGYTGYSNHLSLVTKIETDGFPD